jgi:drug/metabolite transporter (DMT)-like permease
MKKGFLYIAVTTLLFSSMEVALKFISGQFNPVQLTFSRFLIGGVVLIPLAVRTLRSRGERVDGKALSMFALLGLLGVSVSMTLYQLAVVRVNASVIGVLFSSNPVFVTLFAFLILHEQIKKNQAAGLVLDILGILVIINPFGMRMDLTGILCCMAATLLFALYGVLGKRQCARFGGVVVTCFGFLFGAAEMMALAVLTHIPALADALSGTGLDVFSAIPFFTGYTLSSLPVVLYVFIGVTGVGYTCYFLAMEETSAQQASLVFFFKPALAPVLALLLLHEEIPLNMLAGIALILCGSLLSLLPGLLAARQRTVS